MTEIAVTLKLDTSTVSRDIKLIREEAKLKQAEYIESELPFRHKLRAAAMDKAIKELWQLFYKENDSRAKKAILDSITEALLKQAAIDGDPLAIEKAIKLTASLQKKIPDKESEPCNGLGEKEGD